MDQATLTIDGSEPGAILVGFGEASALAEAARGLIDAGHRVLAFQRAGRRNSGQRRYPRGMRRLEITAPEDDAARSVTDLLDIAEAVRAAAVMPLDDAAVWLVAEAAPDLDAAVIGPTGALVDLALDRRVQLTGAELAGLAVPETVTCQTHADLLAVAGRSLVLRPALSVYEHGGRLVRPVSRRWAVGTDLEQLATHWDDRVSLLAQEVVDGRLEEVTGLVTRSGFDRWSVERPSAAAADAIDGYGCETVASDQEFLDRCEALLAEAHWRGPFRITFVRDVDDRLWFIGLGGGWTPSAASVHPAAAVADALGLSAPYR